MSSQKERNRIHSNLFKPVVGRHITKDFASHHHGVGSPASNKALQSKVTGSGNHLKSLCQHQRVVPRLLNIDGTPTNAAPRLNASCGSKLSHSLNDGFQSLVLAERNTLNNRELLNPPLRGLDATAATLVAENDDLAPGLQRLLQIGQQHRSIGPRHEEDPENAALWLRRVCPPVLLLLEQPDAVLRGLVSLHYQACASLQPLAESLHVRQILEGSLVAPQQLAIHESRSLLRQRGAGAGVGGSRLMRRRSHRRWYWSICRG